MPFPLRIPLLFPCVRTFTPDAGMNPSGARRRGRGWSPGATNERTDAYDVRIMAVTSSAAGTRMQTRLLGIGVTLLVAMALYLTRPVILPLVAGMIIVMIVWPVQLRLERVIPRVLAYTVTFLLVLAGALLIAALLWFISRELLEDAPLIAERLSALREQAGAWLSRQGVEAEGGGGGADMLASLAPVLARITYALSATVLLTLGFAMLMLVEVHDAEARVRRSLPHGEAVIEAVAEIAWAVRRFFVAKSITSTLTGSATLAFAFAVGIDRAMVWGVISFLFQYVPSVGSVLAIIPPALYALVQFDDTARIVLTILGFSAIQFFLGVFVDPRIEGRIVALSPTVVLLSIIGWALIWGPLGALLGVPLTMIAVLLCRRFEATRWIAVLLAGDEPGKA